MKEKGEEGEVEGGGAPSWPPAASREDHPPQATSPEGSALLQSPQEACPGRASPPQAEKGFPGGSPSLRACCAPGPASARPASQAQRAPVRSSLRPAAPPAGSPHHLGGLPCRKKGRRDPSDRDPSQAPSRPVLGPARAPGRPLRAQPSQATPLPQQPRSGPARRPLQGLFSPPVEVESSPLGLPVLLRPGPPLPPPPPPTGRRHCRRRPAPIPLSSRAQIAAA